MPNVVGDSSDDAVPAVSGTHTAGGPGVLGTGVRWTGVVGRSVDQTGVTGTSEGFVGVWGESLAPGHAGVFGVSAQGEGVVGESRSPDRAGVWGRGTRWTGVVGTSVDQTGVSGTSEKFIGMWGESRAPGFAGVYGISQQGDGVVGESRSPVHSGVYGKGSLWTGVYGDSVEQTGVTGVSQRFVGIWAETRGTDHPALLAKSPGGRAGRFEGDVEVTGDLLLTGADVAEQFDVAAPDGTAPGTVVVLDDAGALSPCARSYDTRVAGVVSGAGDRVPALVLDRGPGGRTDRAPVAVVGKVWCRAHAADEPIRVGDLLTTSGTVGHAMRAVDRDSAFGAVLGKALTPLATGAGLVLVLVGLC